MLKNGFLFVFYRILLYFNKILKMVLLYITIYRSARLNLKNLERISEDYVVFCAELFGAFLGIY